MDHFKGRRLGVGALFWGSMIRHTDLQRADRNHRRRGPLWKERSVESTASLRRTRRGVSATGDPSHSLRRTSAFQALTPAVFSKPALSPVWLCGRVLIRCGSAHLGDRADDGRGGFARAKEVGTSGSRLFARRETNTDLSSSHLTAVARLPPQRDHEHPHRDDLGAHSPDHPFVRTVARCVFRKRHHSKKEGPHHRQHRNAN
jgi:hypothetical protein